MIAIDRGTIGEQRICASAKGGLIFS